MNLLIRRSAILYLLVFSELLLLYVYRNGDGAYLLATGKTVNLFLREQGGLEFLIASHIRSFFRVGFIAYVLISIALGLFGLHRSRNLSFLNSLHQLHQLKISLFTVVINLLLFASLIGLFFMVSDPAWMIDKPYSYQSLMYALSPILWITYLASICHLMFPIQRLMRLVAQDWFVFAIVCVSTLCISHPQIYESFVIYWSDLLLLPTIDLASFISRMFGLDYRILSVSSDAIPSFGSSQYVVSIAPGCSGYEGMTLIVLLLVSYCYLQRKTLRLYRALLIIPIACLMMFLLNGLRIFILLAIGHYWSPQLALDGFHSVGGWFNLLLVFMLSLLALNWISYFQSKKSSQPEFHLGRGAMLAPLMMIIVVGLLARVISPNFAWLYPFSILAAVFTFYLFRAYLVALVVRPAPVAFFIGILVFLIWIILVPENPDESMRFIQELTTAPLWVSLLWLMFRIIGASLVIPLAEELAFRGYIQTHLEEGLGRSALGAFKVPLSLATSAILFGLVHSHILAGLIAGLLYGLAYLYRRQLIDAVIAHALTNLLLSIYIIFFAYWSYW